MKRLHLDAWSLTMLVVFAVMVALIVGDVEPHIHGALVLAAFTLIIPAGVHTFVRWRRDRRALKEAIATYEAFEQEMLEKQATVVEGAKQEVPRER